jgi:hypothetical protein
MATCPTALWTSLNTAGSIRSCRSACHRIPLTFFSLSTWFYFSAYKNAYRNALDEAMSSCCEDSYKVEFLHALKDIRREAFFLLTQLPLRFGARASIPTHPEVVSRKNSSSERPETPESRVQPPTPDPISCPTTPSKAQKPNDAHVSSSLEALG